MADSLNKIFNFNKGQRRAIVILSMLIFVLIIYRFWQANTPKEIINNDRAINEINDFIKSQDSVKQQFNNTLKESKLEKNIVINLKPFNPNMMTKKSWLELGLNEYQANSIQKYVSAGGQFYKKEDLKKMYCLSANDYNRLEPYILLDLTIKPESKVKKNSTTKYLQIELNAATTESLLDVSGIGEYFAKNIIKYRDMLGGFYSVEQLREVYGVDSAKYEKIYRNFNVDIGNITKIDLNKSNFNTLKKHPYIGKKIAFEISNYLKYKGKFKSVEDLKNSISIKDADYKKIYHYFVVY